MMLHVLQLSLMLLLISLQSSLSLRQGQRTQSDRIQRFNQNIQSRYSPISFIESSRLFSKPVDVPEEYQEWEREEMENQMLELQDIARKEKEEFGEIPDYMMKLLKRYSIDIEDTVAEKASKLPTIAIIGRPNTGKSTLVNKLANSYKVPTKYNS